MVAAFAGFGLLYTLFSKFFPMVSLNDMQEGKHLAASSAMGRTTVKTVVMEE